MLVSSLLSSGCLGGEEGEEVSVASVLGTTVPGRRFLAEEGGGGTSLSSLAAVTAAVVGDVSPSPRGRLVGGSQRGEEEDAVT